MRIFPALAKATAFNANVILNHLSSGVAATKAEISKVCVANGYADEMSIETALRQITDDGLVVVSGDGASTAYTITPQGTRA